MCGRALAGAGQLCVRHLSADNLGGPPIRIAWRSGRSPCRIRDCCRIHRERRRSIRDVDAREQPLPAPDLHRCPRAHQPDHRRGDRRKADRGIRAPTLAPAAPGHRPLRLGGSDSDRSRGEDPARKPGPRPHPRLRRTGAAGRPEHGRGRVLGSRAAWRGSRAIR